MAKPIIDPKVQQMINQATPLGQKKPVKLLALPMFEDGKLGFSNQGYNTLELLGISKYLEIVATSMMFPNAPDGNKDNESGN